MFLLGEEEKRTAAAKRRQDAVVYPAVLAGSCFALAGVFRASLGLGRKRGSRNCSVVTKLYMYVILVGNSKTLERSNTFDAA